MKRISIILATLLTAVILMQGSAAAQFKNQQNEEKAKVSDSMIKPDESSIILGFFDPANFSMRHSYSFSYYLMSGRSVGIGMYTNSMFYKVSDLLNMHLDVSAMHSPFNSFGRQYQNDLSKIFISRAEVNFQPWSNFLIRLQYQQIPYNAYYNRLYSPFYYYPY